MGAISWALKEQVVAQATVPIHDDDSPGDDTIITLMTIVIMIIISETNRSSYKQQSPSSSFTSAAFFLRFLYLYLYLYLYSHLFLPKRKGVFSGESPQTVLEIYVLMRLTWPNPHLLSVTYYFRHSIEHCDIKNVFY